ncbi:MAG: HAD family hydrolase [Flavobacterium sp. BFFFF2]|nr:MAG: HAD family hydrolase [Flavobacterium sp. BFFFF2]
MLQPENIDWIAFDADDTLWHNEPYFDEAQQRFAELFQNYVSHQEALQVIFQHQVDNLPLYGFGIKAFTLSMMDSALEITQGKLTGKAVEMILQIGRDLLQKPVELLPEVIEVLTALQKKHALIVATKGDLKDQHRKLHDSGLGAFFHRIEVLSDKTTLDYQKMLDRLACKPERFVMIGNSLRSDVLPVLQLGGHAFHIAYHTTWEYEKIDFELKHENFKTLGHLSELLQIL